MDKAKIVEMANAVQPLLDGSMQPIEALLNANDIVFAVWQGADEPDGVGFRVVKGQRRLMAITTSNKAEPLKMTAIPCISLEQAVALQQVAGETDPLN